MEKASLNELVKLRSARLVPPRYKHINAIILEQQGKDSAAPLANFDGKPLQHEGYLRGADYYANLKQRSGGKA